MPAPPALETVFVVVPEHAVEAYEAALATACRTVGFFLADEDNRIWRIEGVKPVGTKDAELANALILAGVLSGCEAVLHHQATAADGWLALTQASFPEQRVGRRFAVRGTHLKGGVPAGRIALIVDAGVAFGSGEHGSTRGCLRALEAIAHRRPRRILDLGTGSGILAIAAAKLFRVPVLATDIDARSAQTARDNARLNGVGSLVTAVHAAGLQAPEIIKRAPFDLVMSNILLRPLQRLAAPMARQLEPNARIVLSGILKSQANAALTAYRSQGLMLERSFPLDGWFTPVMVALSG